MDDRLMRYVPKSKIDAIRDIYHDSDGYWVCLNKGWNTGYEDCHTIHTDTITELRQELRWIEKGD